MHVMQQQIGKIERRHRDRRQPFSEETISTHRAFDADERRAFKHLERRRHLRRDADVRRAVSQIEA
jgi:hypothetical protein